MNERREEEVAGGRIRVIVDGRVAEVHLNRPDQLNALTIEMLHALANSIRCLSKDEGIRALILTGRGRAFSAGDDLKESLALTTESFATLIDAFQEITRVIVTSPVPVIAAVNGIAVGGAAEITVACDLRIGGPNTEFFLPENGIGLTISNGSSVLIPALVGKRAIGFVLMERRVGIEEAAAVGLVDHVVNDGEDVLEEARRVASRLSEDTTATHFHLQLLRPAIDLVEEALEKERQAAADAWEAGVVRAGLTRFWEERSPRH